MRLIAIHRFLKHSFKKRKNILTNKSGQITQHIILLC